MSADKQSTERIPCYCALCISRCGSIAVVDDGRFVALEPDPSHPTGQAIYAKGRAAPELVYHQDRPLYLTKRTRPKGDPDPGWQRISWDEALDLTAANLRRIAPSSVPILVEYQNGGEAMQKRPAVGEIHRHVTLGMVHTYRKKGK